MQKPNLSFWELFNLSFGFFGVQIAYALQSANISRIFATLGADPHQLSFFWILPPLMGMIVQPLIGYFSDKTWCRFGRRIPYLFIGAIIAVAVMVMLPNAGSLGLTTQVVLWGLTGSMIFGLFSLMFLDTSINIAMQPFKMMVGDMVNNEQKTQAYSIQSFLCNAGSVVGYLFPFIFTFLGVQNIAPKGMIPNSVIYSFYVGAAILILCSMYTALKVKEYTPEQMAQYSSPLPTSPRGGDDTNASLADSESQQENHIKNLSPSGEPERGSGSGVWNTFLTIGLVQFFCWAAFMYMWTYSTGSIAEMCWGSTDVHSAGYQEAANWNGVVYAVQAIGSVVWAACIPSVGKMLHSDKLAYSLSLVLGGIGFISMMFVTNQYVLFVSYLLVGCAWAAMLAFPFIFFTNALQGNPKMGTYLGLFNCTICLPQIIAAVCGGAILSLVGGTQPMMLVVAGIFLICGAASVFAIKAK